MAWRRGSKVSEVRRAFLAAYANGAPIDELCAHYDVSRSTGYALVAKARKVGVDVAVEDKSRAPLRSPHSLPREAVDHLVALRVRYGFGPAKLAVLYEEAYGSSVSKGAVANVLRAHGLSRPYRYRHHAKAKTVPTKALAPNDCWAMDHKGPMGKQRVEPLTVIDQYSRYWLCCHPFADKTYRDTRTVCELLFDALGTPLVIRVDAGSPWATTSSSRLTRLSAWWLSLGIRTEIVTCQQNGVVERLHGTMEREMSLNNVVDLRAHFDEKRALYNHVRPHESLRMKRPGEVYVPSPRRPVEKAPDYSECDEVRSVGNRGEINWCGRLIYVSEALVDFRVGIRQLDLNLWAVRYYDVTVGIFDKDHDKIRPPNQ